MIVPVVRCNDELHDWEKGDRFVVEGISFGTFLLDRSDVCNFPRKVALSIQNGPMKERGKIV